MTIENELEVMGFWWILGYDETKFPGVLTYSKENGTTLKIFQNEKHEEIYWDNNYDIISGVADTKIFTLYKSSLIASSSSRINYYTFRPELLLCGSFYLEYKEDLKFSKITSEINNTIQWFRRFNSFQIETKVKTEEHININIKIKPLQIDFNISDSLTGYIYAGYTNSNRSFDQSFRINGTICFGIESKDKSLIEYHILSQKMNVVRIFFSILFGSICTYEEQFLKRPEFDTSLRLYTRNSFGESAVDYALFEFEDVEDTFGNILENWFQLQENIPEVISLFYNSFTANQFYEYHFRESYIALEGIFQWKKNQDTQNKHIINILLNELMRTKKDTVSDFEEIVKDYKRWGEVARRNRHFQTHLNKIKYVDDIVDTQDLFTLNKKILAIVLFYILEGLGFSDEQINNVFKKHKHNFLPHFY